MRKLEYPGYFYDGESPKKYNVAVTLQADGIVIKSPEFEEIKWFYEHISRSPELYSDNFTQLENIEFKNQRLVIEDPDFLSVVREFFPSLKFKEPPKMISVKRMAVLGLLLLLVIIPTYYYFLLPSFSEFVAEKIPVSVEKRLSAPYLSLFVPKDSICNDEKHYIKIEKIFNVLTSTIPDSKYEFKLFVVKSDILNAFALPGGYIVIYSGLLEKTDRPEQLAGVMAHEIQHIEKRHGTEALVKDYSLGFLIAAVTGDTRTIETTLGLAKFVGLMNYSRESETEADVAGIGMMKRAGVDPEGMVEFFEILNEHTAVVPDSLQHFSSHPQTEERINKLKELSRNKGDAPLYFYSKKDWEKIRNLCDNESIKKFSFTNLY